MAHATGYYDQSHMIHDFLEIYGMTPEAVYPQVRSSPTFRFSGLLDLASNAPKLETDGSSAHSNVMSR